MYMEREMRVCESTTYDLDPVLEEVGGVSLFPENALNQSIHMLTVPVTSDLRLKG